MSVNEKMMTADLMKKAEESILHTYNRYPVVFSRGEGVYLFDTDNKRYLDFASGIGVNALGYHYPGYDEAIADQAGKLMHVSNLYYSEPLAFAGEKLLAVSGMDRVFFTNSGAEAVEGAIKAARKYAFLKDNSNDHGIIAFESSFHGRTFGALSVTGNEAYRTPFSPMIGNISFARFNDLSSVEELIDEKTCAVIMETVQGEGGIYPADADFIKGVRALCDERDILLILDEIQCGMGRTGYMFAYEKYGIKPDILTTAKGLGCGFPVGAFLMNEKTSAASLVPGDHGTTYGGNALALAVVSKVLDLFAGNNIIEHVRDTAVYFEERLDALIEEFPCLKERRGAGLMQGIVCGVPVNDIINASLKEGLLVISAGGNVLRFLPPLIITRGHIDEMTDILRRVLS